MLRTIWHSTNKTGVVTLAWRYGVSPHPAGKYRTLNLVRDPPLPSPPFKDTRSSAIPERELVKTIQVNISAPQKIFSPPQKNLNPPIRRRHPPGPSAPSRPGRPLPPSGTFNKKKKKRPSPPPGTSDSPFPSPSRKKTCWEVLPLCRFQRQRCIKILCPKDLDFYTPLALKTAKGQHLPALAVYKNRSPNFVCDSKNHWRLRLRCRGALTWGDLYLEIFRDVKVAPNVLTFIALVPCSQCTCAHAQPMTVYKNQSRKSLCQVCFSGCIDKGESPQRGVCLGLPRKEKTCFKGAQTMKCKLWTETLEFSRLKVPNSRFALHGLAPPY